MNLSSCHAKTAKTITNSYKQKLLFITCGPLNFHFSNWWIWPSPNVNTTLDQEQERDKWNIITILNAREMPRSFLSLWTHLSLFSACTPSRLPVALCYCCWNSSAPLTTVNAQLVFECRTRPLSLGFLPPLCLPLLLSGHCLLSCFKCFKARRSSLVSRCQSIQGCSVIWGQQRCCWLACRILIYMTFTLFQAQ